MPYNENVDDLVLDFEEDEVENTKTFAINLNENIISGEIDELDALQQSIYLMLSIEADQYIIYPYTYAMKKLDLIGKPSHYVMAILPDRIKETLLSDDRITDVTDFEFELNGNNLRVTFVVHSIYGNITEETEVAF